MFVRKSENRTGECRIEVAELKSVKLHVEHLAFASKLPYRPVVHLNFQIADAIPVCALLLHHSFAS